MIGQPSVNDLASVFRGNPGPLQARVNQDMQGQPPGTLPKDLKDLLALQIVTNEQDAAKRSAAMQQLNQMQPQGPQGEPPTVAQSLQEQAKQKLQAQMVQQMRQQQGLQGLMQQLPPGAVPEQTPQPQEQPEAQGLDMLPSNMGENYAGGGIIAFAGDKGSVVPNPNDEESDTYETPYDRRNRLLNESGRRFGDPKDIEGIQKALAFAGAPIAALADILALPVNAVRNLVRNPLDTSERPSLTPASDARREFLNLPEERPVPQAAPNVRPTMANDPRLLTSPQGQNIAAVDRMTSTVGQNVVRTPPARPVAPVQEPPAAPAMSDREKFLAAQFGKTPDADAAEAAYESKVGQRSTADLAALADEIAARRQMLKERANPMIDYLRGIAMAPRGEKWMQSGVRGGMYADEVRAAREAQDMELLQKLMETKGKIADIEYGYKKEKFGVGRDAANKEYERVFKAAELMGYDERAAKEMAFKAAEGVLDRKNRLESARIMADARMGGAGEKQTLAELKALQSSISNELKNPLMMGPKGNALREQLRQVNAAIAKMAGLDTMAGAPSAPSPGGNRPPLSSFQR